MGRGAAVMAVVVADVFWRNFLVRYITWNSPFLIKCKALTSWKFSETFCSFYTCEIPHKDRASVMTMRVRHFTI